VEALPDRNAFDELKSLTSDLNTLSADIQCLLDEAVVKEPLDDRFLDDLAQIGRQIWFFFLCIGSAIVISCIVFLNSFGWIEGVRPFLPAPYHLPLKIAVFVTVITEGIIVLVLSWQSVGALCRFRRSLEKYSEERKIRLLSAMQAGKLEQFKELVIADPTIVNAKDSLGENLLHKAVLSGNAEALEFLLNRGFGVNEKNNADVTALHEAAGRGHLDMVEMLMVHGAEVDTSDMRAFTPLHLATRNGHGRVVELLIAGKADLNARTKTGDTPLLCALSQQLSAAHADIAALLVEQGADVSQRNNARQTPLHLAAEQGYNKIARMLIERGADVNAVDSSGWTPLHRAVQRGNIRVMELLLEHRAEVNARTDIGVTPVFGSWTSLHFAVNLGYMSALELLITRGADVNSRVDERGKPYGGYSPLAMAIEMYSKRKGTTDLQIQKEIAEILISYGATE